MTGTAPETPILNGPSNVKASPRARLEKALREPEPSRAVLGLARTFRDESMSQLEMYRLFDEFRALHEGDADLARYDAILDTMDCIVGWCAAGSRLYDTDLPARAADDWRRNAVELLTVEDSFQISGRGVVVVPDFPLPEGWEDRRGMIVVVTPDGRQYDATARFSRSHFEIRDPNVAADKRWRVVVLLPDGKKEDLPVGSRILVSREVRDALVPSSAA